MLVGVGGLVVGALAGASVVAAIGSGVDTVGCNEAAASALDGYAYDPGLVVALGHAITDGHPELEALADTVHRAEADRVGAEGDPAGDVAVDYLSALATLAERPELATDEVLDALRAAATASPDLNDLAPVDGDRAGGVVAISALLRRSEAYSPATEPPELTALIDEVARRQRAARTAGMRPIAGCDASTENGRQGG